MAPFASTDGNCGGSLLYRHIRPASLQLTSPLSSSYAGIRKRRLYSSVERSNRKQWRRKCSSKLSSFTFSTVDPEHCCIWHLHTILLSLSCADSIASSFSYRHGPEDPPRFTLREDARVNTTKAKKSNSFVSWLRRSARFLPVIESFYQYL
jgi:hypothetical protein